ncbi:alpha-hydroxy-acid oxidizing protein [Nocardioides sp. JQ2195]|uniref:alpha-hydroxy acid oxidase n=1 Tax=Nocardioides sp. JQ2195 TaxID=2592334 RepID=UPI00143EDF99|nr:alpha-hydroxy acid oxidase [Nocardioides sp. JQ2195]QIX27536.1 alpha-hydroxy-acid oxidizing protein [Nocardioides sp. JQ2195]
MDANWLDGVEEAARHALPAPVHRYIRQGAGASVTAAEAGRSWDRIRFAPHVLRDVTDVDLRTTLLGSDLSTPIGVAPTTFQRAAHPDGEVAMARAAADAGSVMVVSSNAGSTFVDIAGTGVTWWLQAYLSADRTLTEPLLRRAVDAGARAVVLTVDTPVVGTKHDDGPTVWETTDPGWLRVNFDAGYDDLPGAQKALDLGPHDIEWLSSTTGLPVVVKGVLRPDDARRCVQAGAAAVWVSNHGGRQLDRTVASAEVLESVVAAVGGDAEVYVDGGLRSGSDVLAAMALGADAAFLGRLPLWCLAAGEERVLAMHRTLAAQLTEATRLAGLSSPSQAVGVLAPKPPFGP